ncbi:hypothetical protein SLEP1_g4706 [Rubroshorea leprosula]|uniref:RRM domain-containing protein n=1 Tax=Rubroshorea leprosula TaxID=152421 RepID=A0AAV5HXP6_9ROSI|nr:hypothetical protein SLEP1_g4706 [Rubroshorea leprosula]
MQKLGLYDKGLYKQAIPYFFTNFPEEWSYADMWRTFLKFGRVYDIYSPNRKSRSGGRFGFVRFLNVKDKRELERQLDQIWVGDQKLWVNIPRYDDEKKEENKGRNGQTMAPKFQSRSYAKIGLDNGLKKFNLGNQTCSWGKFICLDDSTSNKRRFDISKFLISTPIMDTISVTRQVKVNGVLFNIKFKEEEFTNSFFSLKQDFIPSFHSDSEDHESWSLGTDTDAMKEGFEKTQEPGEESSTEAGEEDDERTEQIRKRKKRKSHSCRSLYSNAANAVVESQRRNSQGRKQTQGKEGKEGNKIFGFWEDIRVEKKGVLNYG